MEIYIIRHGQTESNRQKRILGSKDEDINDFGYKQVLNAKKRLKI